MTPVITGTATKLVISFDAAAYYPTAINSYPNATSLSWTHTATAGAYVIVDVVTDRVGITSVKYGGSNGTAMTQALSVNLGDDGVGTSGTYARFVLANVVGGAQTVYVTFPATAIWTAAGSVSYTNVVSSFSTASPVTLPASNTTLNQTVTYPASGMIVNALAAISNRGNPLTSSSGGNLRVNAAATLQSYYTYAILNMRDSNGTATFSETVTWIQQLRAVNAYTVLLPTAQTNYTGSAPLTVTPTTAATVGKGISAAASLTVNPTRTAGVGKTYAATSALSVTPTATASAAVTRRVTSALSVTPVITASENKIEYAATTGLVVTPTVSASASVTRYASAAVTVTPTVSTTAAKTRSAAVSLTVTPSTSASATTTAAPTTTKSNPQPSMPIAVSRAATF